MAVTTNYSWYLPVIGGDSGTWGNNPTGMNGNLIAIDAQVKATENLANTMLPKAGGVCTGLVDNLTQRVKIVALGSVSGAVNIDCAAGQFFTLTLSGNATLTIINAPTGSVYMFPILFRIATAGFTPTFAGGTFKWVAGAPPTWTATAGRCDNVSFETEDAGANWREVGITQNVAV
jgi:hypothetical protein